MSTIARRLTTLAGCATLATAAFAGCGGMGSESAGGDTAVLPAGGGGEYTVTLGPGQEEAVDIFGRSGDGPPVGIFQPGSGSNVQVARGDMFAIALNQQAGAGRGWTASGGTADGVVVRLVQQWVLRADTTPKGPGTHYFLYRATREGRGILRFSARADAGGTASPTAAFAVTVTG